MIQTLQLTNSLAQQIINQFNRFRQQIIKQVDLLENAMNKALEEYINKDTLYKCTQMEDVEAIIASFIQQTEYKEQQLKMKQEHLKTLENIKNNLEIKQKSVIQIIQNQRMEEIIKAPLFDFKIPKESTGPSLFNFLTIPSNPSFEQENNQQRKKKLFK